MYLLVKKKTTNVIRHERLPSDYFSNFKKKVFLTKPKYFFKNDFFLKMIFLKKKFFWNINSAKVSITKINEFDDVYNNCYPIENPMYALEDEDDFNFFIKFLIFSSPGDYFYFIYDSNTYKILYKASNGNYTLLHDFDWDLQRIVFKMPSGKYKFFPLTASGFCGRASHVFANYKVFGKFSKKVYWKKKKLKVRGVAMNCVDHHNGGSSKIKKPFLNKYGKLAKKGK